FFFSSRRRHTRFSRDWSSDVCSSDLNLEAVVPGVDDRGIGVDKYRLESDAKLPNLVRAILFAAIEDAGNASDISLIEVTTTVMQIGRASCRDGVYDAGWVGS